MISSKSSPTTSIFTGAPEAGPFCCRAILTSAPGISLISCLNPSSTDPYFRHVSFHIQQTKSVSGPNWVCVPLSPIKGSVAPSATFEIMDSTMGLLLPTTLYTFFLKHIRNAVGFLRFGAYRHFQIYIYDVGITRRKKICFYSAGNNIQVNAIAAIINNPNTDATTIRACFLSSPIVMRIHNDSLAGAEAFCWKPWITSRRT